MGVAIDLSNGTISVCKVRLERFKPMPKVDAVILVLDRAELTLETLENILDQRGVEAAVWLVDQGSRPENVAKLRNKAPRDKRITLEELGRNIGVAAGRNLGMRKGEAKTIISIDNDAIFSSEHALLEAADLFAEKPELGAVSFRIDNYGTGELDVNSWVFPKKLLERRNSGFLTTRFTGGGNAIRREAFQATKGYDERLFFYWEELDLAYQMIAEGYTILYEPSIVVRHKTVAEGGVNWKQERFYFLVRNALYLDWKYFKQMVACWPWRLGIWRRVCTTGWSSRFIEEFGTPWV